MDEGHRATHPASPCHVNSKNWARQDSSSDIEGSKYRQHELSVSVSLNVKCEGDPGRHHCISFMCNYEYRAESC